MAFIQCLFPVARIPPQLAHYLDLSGLLRCLLAVTFLKDSLFLTLTVLRSAGQVFFRMSLNWDLSAVFLMIAVRWWGFRRKVREVKCHFYHLHKVHSIDKVYHC